eukprot:COSAG06_NODE_1356_length_9731_cov_18.547654_2_plen_108_part_00
MRSLCMVGDDEAGTVLLYEDIVHQEQVQAAMLALLDQLGVAVPPAEGVPPESIDQQLLTAAKARAHATAGQALQLAGDAKSTFADKALSGKRTVLSCAFDTENEHLT